MRIFLLFIISTCFIFSAKAQIVNIPDANFKNALLNHNPVINTNNDGEIQVSEAVAFTGNLFVFNKNISDLTGIEAFINILSLSCENNRLTSLAFGNFTRLNTLNCQFNNLTSLNLTNLPALTRLFCQNNQLTALPLSAFTSVKSLYCSSNKLTSLVFDNSFALETLECYLNQLTTLSISNVSVLKNFNCAENQIAGLSIGNVPQLQNFECSKNKLTSLNMGSAPLLTYLPCHTNLLTSLSLTNFPALQTINCGNNLLTSISLTNTNALQQLFCSNNKLVNLTLNGYPSLSRIDCDHNDLTTISLNNLPVLQNIFGDYNQLTAVVLNNLPALKYVTFNFSKLDTLNLNGLPALQSLNLHSNLLTSIMLSNLPGLTHLDCRINLLTTLDLSQTAVKTLHCAANPNLQYINIKNGSISLTSAYFILSTLPALKSICADDTEFLAVTDALNTQLPGQHVVVSSFCNFNPNGNYNTIIGKLRFDENSNGCDNPDSSMYNVKINIDDGAQTGSTFTNAQGDYKFFVTQNSNTVTTFFENPYFITTPPSQTITFAGYGNTQSADFCITKNGFHPDLEITLLPVTIARPGFDAQYRIVYRNKGNRLQSGTAILSFDAVKLNFLSAIPNVTSQTTGNLTWSFAGLSPYQTGTINLVFHVHAPPVVHIGDILPFVAVINPIPGDEMPNDNTFNFNQVVRGAIDPNDKEVTEGSTIPVSKIGDYLHYIIRFQNTGNEPATSVVIKDSLANNLDWNSLVPLTASHPFRAVATKGNNAEFIFDGINLPGMNTNEPASHGFVSFKIKPIPTVTIGETIYNKAEIYFDFNLPVITNTVSTTITNARQTNDLIGLSTYPNPVKNEIRFTLTPGNKIKAINVYNTVGEKLYSETVINPGNDRKVNIANLPAGILLLQVITNAGTAVQKIIRLK